MADEMKTLTIGDTTYEIVDEKARKEKLDASELPTAINTALAQAKASGEFDGETGKDGKSAYEYAQDGGYTGTEADFAEKLAQEPLVGTTADITPSQVVEAIVNGRDLMIIYTDKSFGMFYFTSFDINASLGFVFSSAILVYNGMYAVVELIGNTTANTWQFVVQQIPIMSDIPTKMSQLENDSEYMTLAGYQIIAPKSLKNPYAMTINGTTYDGSSAVDMTAKINELIDSKLGVIENGSY